MKLLVGNADRLEALVGKLAHDARSQLLAHFGNHFAAVGVDEIGFGLGALHGLRVERHAPAVAVARQYRVRVEGRKDFLAVEAERHQQRRCRDLAAAVDARKHDVLGVELDVEPGAAIRDDARGEQQLARRMGLALVVVEEHARRAVHLGDDDALGAVDDEGAVVGHERHVAHVDILLLDVLDRLRAGVLVDIEHDETQRHLQRRGIGHVALAALVDVVFRRLEIVAHEFQHRCAGEIGDRKHRAENGLQALVGAAAIGLLDHQELVVRGLLDLDEVRHFRDFADVAEELANALASVELYRLDFFGLSHGCSRFSFAADALNRSPEGALPFRTPSGHRSGMQPVLRVAGGGTGILRPLLFRLAS